MLAALRTAPTYRCVGVAQAEHHDRRRRAAVAAAELPPLHAVLVNPRVPLATPRRVRELMPAARQPAPSLPYAALRELSALIAFFCMPTATDSPRLPPFCAPVVAEVLEVLSASPGALLRADVGIRVRPCLTLYGATAGRRRQRRLRILAPRIRTGGLHPRHWGNGSPQAKLAVIGIDNAALSRNENDQADTAKGIKTAGFENGIIDHLLNALIETMCESAAEHEIATSGEVHCQLLLCDLSHWSFRNDRRSLASSHKRPANLKWLLR